MNWNERNGMKGKEKEISVFCLSYQGREGGLLYLDIWGLSEGVSE